MNINIKRSLFILIFITSSINYLLSIEFVITIPKEYNKIELPLPPFPLEIINELPVNNYDIILIEDIIPRDLTNVPFFYTYYDNFLKRELHFNNIITQDFGLSTNIKNSEFNYTLLFHNNYYSFKSYFSLSTDLILDLQFEYKEFRLPLDLSFKGNLLEKNINIHLGDKNYNYEWFISPSISLGKSELDLYYKNSSINNLLFKGKIDTDLKNHIVFGIGTDIFRLGIIEINLHPLLYLGLNKEFNTLIFEFETEVKNSKFNYNFGIKFTKLNNLKTSLGLKINDDYTNIKPYLYISENFILGNRVYMISEEELNFKFSFIKDDLTSIISLEILNLNQYNISLDFNLDRINFRSYFLYEYTTKKYELGLSINYKVGKL